MAHDLIIRNGVVIDGTGSPGFEADVAVDGENIAAIGKNLGAGKKRLMLKDMWWHRVLSILIPIWTPSWCSTQTATL